MMQLNFAVQPIHAIKRPSLLQTDKKHKPPILLRKSDQRRPSSAIRGIVCVGKLLFAQALLVYVVAGSTLVFQMVCVARIHRAYARGDSIFFFPAIAARLLMLLVGSAGVPRVRCYSFSGKKSHWKLRLRILQRLRHSVGPPRP